MKTLDGLHPTLMRPRVEALLADPEAKTMGVTVVSAFRSADRQAELFAAAVKKYGSVAAARKWVAPPGKSNHGPRVEGYGTAVDFGVRGVQAVSGQWPLHIVDRFDRIARRHGLYSPMEWEDWHFEPILHWTPEDDTVTEDDKADIAKGAAMRAVAALQPQFEEIKEILAGRTPGDPKKRSLIGRIGDAVKAKP